MAIVTILSSLIVAIASVTYIAAMQSASAKRSMTGNDLRDGDLIRIKDDRH